MTTDHSPDYGEKYGYGLMQMFSGGAGHPGAISDYSSEEYFNAEQGYYFFCDSNGSDPGGMAWMLLGEFLSEHSG
jgi:hypothetical protein